MATTELQTSPDIDTTGSTAQNADSTAHSTAHSTAAAPAAVRTLWLASLRAAIATRRASRSTLSRQIAAYPATRSAAVTVVPTVNR